MFLEEPELARRCASVRRVVASGEALPYALKERFFQRLPAAELHNLYGPTEAAVDVTFHACAPGGSRPAVPIGRPIANTAVHVLDRELRPVPVGVAGELFLGGVGLARGYLGRPELTAERFVPDPCSAAPGARLYRTGDLARRRMDGEVEFLGRLDFQVKVRGFRIELGEIEAALAAHPAVREAVVVARQGEGAGEPRLVAYLVPTEPPAPVAELRRFLAQRLPDFMVPAVFVPLAALPLSPNGKIERRALPAPPAERASGAPRVLPRTPLESRLAELWRELLGVADAGVHDNFFELGGDSIQGAMFVNRLQKELGETVYVMALFEAPTIAGLAAYLERSYPASAVRLGGSGGGAAAGPAGTVPADTAEALARLRAAVARRLRHGEGAPPLSAEDADTERNPPAVFLLSPFRSGSTLLRVMLQGHSRLFAPPELELLAFATLKERREAYSGRDAFAREGLLRAVMEIRGCGAEEAEAVVAGHEAAGTSTRRFYGLLQEWIGGRMLVDKTPSYALDPATLGRAEALFREPLYIHLVRHPRAVIRSYVEARMDRVYHDFPFPPGEQAELVWLLSQRNIGEHLAGIPRHRWLRLSFEDLLASPRPVLEELSAFLGLELEPGMLQPYATGRMTDGIREASRMMGDPKFHLHRRIDPEVAERWRREDTGGPLREETAALAALLGYPEAGSGRQWRWRRTSRRGRCRGKVRSRGCRSPSRRSGSGSSPSSTRPARSTTCPPP